MVEEQGQHDWDVIVLGTGAAGLTAAFTAAHAGARVGLYEKGDQVGGTSAWSGGQVWVPNNPHQAEIGVTDSMDEAFTYIMSLSRGLLEERLVRAYLEAGPEMVRHLDEHAGTEFYAVPDFPDYHPEHPGGKPGGGRTIETPLISFTEELGDWAERVTKTPYYPNQHLAMGETPLGAVNPPQLTAEQMEERVARDLRGSGQALVGRLLRAVLAEGVVPQVSSRARELVLEDGRVVGVRIETPKGEVVARARKGVVLASGGFEWNDEYKRAFLRGPLTHPVSVKTNTGDSLYMAMKAGAQLSNMREAWWMPAAELPEGVNAMNRCLINADRTRPRSIMVNRHGRRFTNEAANYNAFGGAFHQEDVVAFDYANLPSWLIFDQEYLRRYGTIGPCPPSEEPPAWLTAYPSLDALAEELGIPARGAESHGRDVEPERRRGSRPGLPPRRECARPLVGDGYKGDKVDPGPLKEPPFYAIRIESGASAPRGARGPMPRVECSTWTATCSRGSTPQARDGLALRGDVWGSGRHPRPRHGLRLHRGSARRDQVTSLNVTSDERQVLNLLSDYCWHVDRRDVNAIVALFVPGGVFDLGFGRVHRGHDELRGMYERLDAYTATSHHCTTPRLDLSDETPAPSGRRCTPSTAGRTVASCTCGARTSTRSCAPRTAGGSRRAPCARRPRRAPWPRRDTRRGSSTCPARESPPVEAALLGDPHSVAERPALTQQHRPHVVPTEPLLGPLRLVEVELEEGLPRRLRQPLPRAPLPRLVDRLAPGLEAHMVGQRSAGERRTPRRPAAPVSRAARAAASHPSRPARRVGGRTRTGTSPSRSARSAGRPVPPPRP